MRAGDLPWGAGGERMSQLQWETEAAPQLQEMRDRVSYPRADGQMVGCDNRSLPEDRQVGGSGLR